MLLLLPRGRLCPGTPATTLTFRLYFSKTTSSVEQISVFWQTCCLPDNIWSRRLQPLNTTVKLLSMHSVHACAMVGLALLRWFYCTMTAKVDSVRCQGPPDCCGPLCIAIPAQQTKTEVSQLSNLAKFSDSSLPNSINEYTNKNMHSTVSKNTQLRFLCYIIVTLAVEILL